MTSQSPIHCKIAFFHFLKNVDGTNALDGSFERNQQHDSQKMLYFNLRIVGDASSDFVIDHFQTKCFRNHSTYKLET